MRGGVPERSDTYSIVIDTTPPVTSLILGPTSSGTFLAPDTTITLASSDTLSGVDLVRYSVDGATFTYTGPFTLRQRHGLSLGSHAFAWWSTDHVANIEAVQSRLLTLDGLGPVTTLRLAGGHQYNDTGANRLYASGDTGYILSADDRGGVGVAYIKVDSGTGAGFQTYTTTVTLQVAGRQVIRYFAADGVGNVGPAGTFPVFVDTQGPPATAFPTLPVVTISTVTYALLATQWNFVFGPDDLSGLDAAFIFADAAPSGSPVQFFTEGPHSILAYATDKVANRTQPPYTQNILIDNTPPASAVLADGVVLSTQAVAAISSTTALSISATDYYAGRQTPGVGVSASQVSIDNGPYQIFTVSFTIPVPGTHTITFYSLDRLGNQEIPQTQNVRVGTAGPLPPITQIVFDTPRFVDGSGPVYISGPTQIGFVAQDRSGSGIALTEYRVDPATGTPFQTFTSSFTLAEGVHGIEYHSKDNAGTFEAIKSTPVQVDATPPVTTVRIGAPQFFLVDGTVLVNAQTSLTVSAVDPVSGGVASGVKDSWVDIDGGGFTLAGGSFTLAGLVDGLHTVSFFSRDQVLNSEVANSTTVVLVATPPTTTLVSPASGAQGVDRSFGRGVVPVAGVASSAGLQNWTLSVASGTDAQAGFVLLSSDTISVDLPSVIYNWNTAALSGPFTLRLSAIDRFGSSSTVTANVLIQDPSLQLVLQNPVSGAPVMSRPEGIAVDSLGQIYLANTGLHNILKFSPQGGLLTTFGSSVTFNNPTGITLDAASNIVVADRGNHRIAFLDPTGTEFLSIGKRDIAGRFIPGSGPGEFNSPTGVAITPTNLVVADTGNRRLQVFDANAGFLFEIKPSTGFAPYGVAVDGSGLIYATDQSNQQVVVFNPDGTPASSFGSPGSGLGQFNTLKGLAVSPPFFVYLADQLNHRLQKVDPLQNAVLAFGATNQMQQPVGVALDAGVALYVTDVSANKVFKFGFSPDGLGPAFIYLTGPTLITAPLQPGMTNGPAGAPGPDASFVFRTAFVFPNPSRMGAKPTVHVEVGIADEVRIRIYDVAGRQLQEATLTGTPPLINGQYAYEYIWDGSIPSGVYFYTVNAKKAGAADIKTQGKFAVVR